MAPTGLLATMDRKTYNRRTITERPGQVTTPEERGQMLAHWLDRNNYLVEDFARDAKISRDIIQKYMSGRQDLLSMRQETAERLIGTMGISDTEFWELFNVPAPARRRIRTFRPPPLGHGEDPRQIREFHLNMPLQGEVQIPAGYVIRVDVASELGLVVTRHDGRLYAVPRSMAQGEILGQLIAADFGTAPVVRQRDRAPGEN